MKAKKNMIYTLWSAAIVLCVLLSVFALFFSACAKQDGEVKETESGGFTLETEDPNAAPETGAPDVPVSLGKAASVRAVCENSGTVLIEKARQKELSAVYELPEKVDAPVAAGQLLGTLRYVAGNETIASVPISAAESVERVGAGELWVRLAAALCGRTNTQ